MPFVRKEGRLVLQQAGQDIDILTLAQSESHPCYIYDGDDVLNRLKALKSSFDRPVSIHYAMKANHHPEILRRIAAAGYGVDTVSMGEVKKAINCGFSADQVVLSGVGKTVAEIDFAIENQIKQINVESVPELQRIIHRSQALGKVASVAFRMNPDVDPKTHPYTSTGFRDNKFGMDQSFLPQLIRLVQDSQGAVRFMGLTNHIGSQIRYTDAFEEATEKTRRMLEHVLESGIQLSTFDIGGGLGIDYDQYDPNKDLAEIGDYGLKMSQALKGVDLEIMTEPGRVIVGRCGILVTEVQYVKETPYKNFLICDSGMHDLIRPALYRAHHRVEPLQLKSGETKIYDVVGPICESADVLGYDRRFEGVEQGDWLAVFDAGAYGAVMASSYNLHEPAKEIVFFDGKAY